MGKKATTKQISARNPRTGLIDYHFNELDFEELRERVAMLRANQVEWQNGGLVRRIEILKKWCDVLTSEKADIIEALSSDTGRRTLSRNEFDGLVQCIDRWCDLAPSLMIENRRQSNVMPDVEVLSDSKAYPVLGTISPWNFPLLLSFIDTVPALLAGSAAFIKSSEVTPRFVVPIAKTIASVPELSKVLSISPGDGKIGEELIRHVDIVAFTGSVSTGKKVVVAAAKAFIPAYLELGGKDPAIIMLGSDLERTASAVLRASVTASGQACQSIERIYVHDRDHEPFTKLLVKKAKQVEISMEDESRDVIGPLILEKQADTINDHLADARSKGAIIECGGIVKIWNGGLWIAPTVITNVSHSMKIMTEESFGPLMPIMAYESEEQAINLANDSVYGLSAAVFGPDNASALALARKINVGGISVNDAGLTAFIHESEKMAFRYSGMGPSRMGSMGLTRFLRKQSIYLNRGHVMPISTLG